MQQAAQHRRASALNIQHIVDESNIQHACAECDAVFDTKEAKKMVGMLETSHCVQRDLRHF